ncbi:FecR family protein [Aestuariibaculum suncheonense]|uniref:FecR family protein n=1 Tax=Aestuariibaculum suncheonense TaxID=1028745 RepID=A0A8J6QBD6_9FLAO|nr:FecR family protein [Aestuariibaculum suncheonense]MBD0836470.1 FecR family protein [Aestuariibaculum suncheonense]
MKNNNDILKWFDNELSEQEFLELKQTENLEILEKIAHYAKHMQAPEVDAQAALTAFRNRKLRKKSPKVITFNFNTVLKIAAILVVMLTSSYFLFFNNDVNFETEIAQTETLTLPDGSEVILNAASKLHYSKKEWQSNRLLDLDGEAFFKVQKGEKFTVNTSAGTVQVLGTQFNVKKRTGYFEVQCYEGLVAVNYNSKIVKLSPGKSFRVVDNTIQLVDDFKAEIPSWLQEESSFDNVPLGEVLKELQRQYSIIVTLQNVDESVLFKGAFTHKNLEIALKSITIPLDLNYKIEGKHVVLSKK